MLTRLSGWASTSSSFTPSSTIYGVPNGVLSHVIYYNKKLFAQAGIGGQPTDFQSLLADVTKLKAAGIVPFSSGDKEGDENQWWLAVLMSEVGTPADATSLALGKTSYTDSVPLREALSRYITLQDAGAFESDRFSNPLGTSTTMFTQGKAAMYLGLSSITSTIRRSTARWAPRTSACSSTGSWLYPDRDRRLVVDSEVLQEQGCRVGLHQVHHDDSRREDPARCRAGPAQ